MDDDGVIMDTMNDLLSRYWEALNDEVSAIENSPSWSGKKDNIRFLAGEIRTTLMFMDAMSGKYDKLIEHVEHAEARSKVTIQFIKKMTNVYEKECMAHGLFNCGNEPGCRCKCHNGL